LYLPVAKECILASKRDWRGANQTRKIVSICSPNQG
jgi:hypothetical protein